MPGRDRTGPMGAGPMTGRRAGLCTGARMEGYEFGRGMGRGRNCRRLPVENDELGALKEQMNRIEQRMEALQARS